MRRYFRAHRIKAGYSQANPHYAGHRWRSARRFAGDRGLGAMPVPNAALDPTTDVRLPGFPRAECGSGYPFRKTPELRDFICQATSLGYTIQQMSSAIGCCAKTLQKHFAPEIAAIRNRQYVEFMHQLVSQQPAQRERVADIDANAWQLMEFSPELRSRNARVEPVRRPSEQDPWRDDVMPADFARYGKRGRRRRR